MQKRIDYFDNVKAILIILVVIGHFIEPLVYGDSIIKSIFIFIYCFHMPTFVFVSGYFSDFNKCDKWIIKLIKRFLVPYIICQCSFIIFTNLVGIQEYRFTFVTPYYIYWYLFAMFIWNIIVKVLDGFHINMKYVILFSFLLGSISGYFEFVGREWSLSRIIIFFPFFLLGKLFRELEINTEKQSAKLPLAISILVMIFILICLKSQVIDIKWLYCNASYSMMNYRGIDPFVFRILVYFVQIILTISFLIIVPKRNIKCTKLGEKTKTIYILHGFIIKALIACDFYNIFSNKYII